MKTLYLVKPEEAELARSLEQKLLALPRSSGILFVGISVKPETPVSAAIYDIVVGCHRDLDAGLMDSLVRHSLREELQRTGIRISVWGYRGVVHENPPRPA